MYSLQFNYLSDSCRILQSSYFQPEFRTEVSDYAKSTIFVLDNTAPSTEINHMMCLAVENKYRPFDRYAPSKRVTAESSPHNPADIVLDILPKPITRTVKRDELKVYKKTRFGTALGSILGFNESKAQNETVDVQSKEMNEYSLQNSDDYFFELMENELYQAEVNRFLKSMKKGRGYLITGFLAASMALVARISGSSSEGDF